MSRGREKFCRGLGIFGILLGMLLPQSCTLPDALTAKNPPGVDNATRFKNWWNFYERGRERLKIGDYVSASEDFERCVGLRPGARFAYPYPAWRIRTYGLYFAENYFPNRELGVTYYFQGKYQDALEKLEISYDALPTARAGYYLDRSRAGLLLGKTIAKPSLKLSEAGPLWVNADRYKLSGLAEGEGWVDRLSTAGRPYYIEVANKKIKFEQTVPLQLGENQLKVEAVDLTGARAERSLTVYRDMETPGLYISSIKKSAGFWKVKGFVRDDQALNEVKLDGRLLYGSASIETRWSFDLELPASSQGLFSVEDRAGNVLKVSLKTDAIQKYVMAGPHVMLAGLDSDVSLLPAESNSSLADVTAPVFDFKGQSDTMVVYQPYVYLQGSITDKGGLTEVTVNGTSWLHDEKSGVTSFHFEHLFEPNEGANRVLIEAMDTSGNRVSKTFDIEKKIPAYLWYKHRLKAVISPVFTEQKDWSGEYLRLMLGHHMQNRPAPFKPRFFIVPSEQAVWEQLLQERALSLSDLADDRARIDLSPMGSLDIFIKTHLYEDRGGLTILAKVVDHDSGAILFMDDVFSATTDGDLDLMTQALMARVEQHFPLVQGVVTKVSGKGLSMKFADALGLAKGTRLLLVKSDAGIEQGRIQLDKQSLPIEVLLDKLSDEKGVGKMQGAGEYSIEKGDFVYTK